MSLQEKHPREIARICYDMGFSIPQIAEFLLCTQTADEIHKAAFEGYSPEDLAEFELARHGYLGQFDKLPPQ